MYHFIDLSHETPQPDAPVLGIEVAPEHAALCTLGNLTSAAHGSLLLSNGWMVPEPIRWCGRAAVDIATEIPLPPDGAVLAASRIDLGTVAAMAVIVLRRLGLWPANEGPDHDSWQTWCRLHRIAAHATRRPPAEWQPRPLPTVEQPWPTEPWSWHEDRELAAIAAICGAPTWIRRGNIAICSRCGRAREGTISFALSHRSASASRPWWS